MVIIASSLCMYVLRLTVNPCAYLRPIDNGTNGKVGGGSVPSFNTDNLVDEVDLLSLLKSTEFDTKLAESIWSKKVQYVAK